jgi:lysophospholipase L1-like esterase
MYRKVAVRHGATLVPETKLRLWFSAELIARDHLKQPLTIDGIHLSPAGATKVANWLEPYVGRLLKR